MGLFGKKYDLVCSKCGKPFKGGFMPSPGRMAYCSDCEKVIFARNHLRASLQKKVSDIERRNKKIQREISKIEQKMSHGLTKEEKAELSKLGREFLENEQQLIRIHTEISKSNQSF